MDEKSYYVGDESKERRGRLDMHQPLIDSIAENWEDVEIYGPIHYTIF